MTESKVAEEALRSIWEGGDAAVCAQRLVERAARDESLNIRGMLAGGAAPQQMADRLEQAGDAAAALRTRLSRYEDLARGAPDAVLARSGAARADANARKLLSLLQEISSALDPQGVEADLDLSTPIGRAKALEAAASLREALLAVSRFPQPLTRLASVRERERRLNRAKERLAAAIARHLNNVLIHRSNEATISEGRPHQHHAELLEYAPFMRWLKEVEEKLYDALLKVYTSTWCRVYEREIRAAGEAARARIELAPSDDTPLDQMLSLVDSIYNTEQDFCTQFFSLDVDVKTDKLTPTTETEVKRTHGPLRKLLSELLPAAEPELCNTVRHMEKEHPYGILRALACISRRVLSEDGGAAKGALAAAAVAAKRGSDKALNERIEGLTDAIRYASKKPKCGVFSFLQEFEEWNTECELIFRDGRRADLERWRASYADAILQTIATATHPKTPKALLRLENYHRLHAILAAARCPELDNAKREARTRYTDALRAYVATVESPLEKLQRFFDGVAEAVASGARDTEVGYVHAYSKQQLKRVLAHCPASEVRSSLRKLHRTVCKQLSDDSGLLQVVWRALLEDLLAQHACLKERIETCYPGSGLTIPLTTQEILDAFSDIAQEQ